MSHTPSRLSSRPAGLCIAAAAALACVAPAHATNGPMPHGYGIKAMGMGGASIALPQDALAAANNPAGMAFVGDRLDLGLSAVIVSPESSIGGTRFDGDGVKAIPVPDFGYNRVIDDRQSIGVSVYGNGVSTVYDVPLLGGRDKDSAELTQVIASPTYAFKLAPGHAIGISADLAWQRFEVEGVPDALGVESPGSDSSTGLGFKLGWSGQVTERITLGAMYSSRIRMGKLKRYRNLLANHGEFDIPERYGIGVAWRPTADIVIAADVMRVKWGDLESLANALISAEPGFGWRSQTLARVGVSWQAAPSLALRTGFSHGQQIVSSANATLNYLAPVTPRKHFTLGATYALSTDSELSFMYARAFGSEVKGSGPSSGIAVDMSQHWVGASLAFKW
ncbi:OmpP1/FadL family transporter [Thauera butanivorans]|uniref:OmpP1/FadL family transporter n=1 Tax=Thauera butanivorans TaxID=86174 RepID=UPI000A030FAF|nr:outer membrane protein transport protein [Thauera butanivorans]